MSIIAPLIGIIGFGLSYGINPSHGWPVALLYAILNKRLLQSGIISSSIIAGAHFISSLAVVVAYIILVNNLDIQIPDVYMRYGAAIALGILAYIFWKEKDEDLVETQHGHLHNGRDNSPIEHYPPLASWISISFTHSLSPHHLLSIVVWRCPALVCLVFIVPGLVDPLLRLNRLKI